jgi:acyl-CoA synthetase
MSYISSSIHGAERSDAYCHSGWWTDKPVADSIGDIARAEPQRVAIVDRSGTMTYAQLDQSVRRAAAGLWNLGLRGGDVLAIQLPNWREFAVFQQAAARIGVAYVPLLPQLREAEIGYLLSACKAKVIVVPGVHRNFDHVAMVNALRSKLPSLKAVFSVDRTPGATHVDAFLAQDWDTSESDAAASKGIDGNALRAILFTSGTESRPKGVLHSYNTLFYSLKLHREYFSLTPEDCILVASPVGHATGAVNGLEMTFLVGCKAMLLEQWNPQVAIETIARERCTMMWGATTFFTDLVRATNLREHDTSCFRLALTAGAPVPRKLVTEVEACFGAYLIAAYGQSEGQNIAINRLDDPIEKITGSDGCFNVGVDYKLVDSERIEVPSGATGELAYRGPNVCHGYLEPAHTAAAFDQEGFIYSGDLASIDVDGYLRILGRRKDIIIRGGENISPSEIEDVLFKHPGIKAVTVIGYPDERLGQRACAVVIPKDGVTVTLADISSFLDKLKMAKFKYPERVILVDQLPMTPSGKVRKEALRQTLFGG